MTEMWLSSILNQILSIIETMYYWQGLVQELSIERSNYHKYEINNLME
jgi:hypothetical protein